MRQNAIDFVKKWPGYQIGWMTPGTKIITTLLLLAASWMGYFIWQYYATEWQWYMIAQCVFGFAAILGIGFIDRSARLDGVTDRHAKLKPLFTVLRAVFIAVLVIIVQKILMLAAILSISDTDLFFYYVYGAVCEEGFFRGVLCRAIAGNRNNFIRFIIAIPASSFAFLLIHVSYYGNAIYMAAVFVSACVMAFWYLWWKDLLASIIAHVIVNFVAVLTILGLM